MTSKNVVLDTSALLAFLHREAGGESIAPLLANAVLSAVNWSESRQKLARVDADVDGIQCTLEQTGTSILPFTKDDANLAADLRGVGKQVGLSFADRACIALAQRLECPVVTADRAWAEIALSVEVCLIR